jgi:hypothetical protein
MVWSMLKFIGEVIRLRYDTIFGLEFRINTTHQALHSQDQVLDGLGSAQWRSATLRIF